MTNPSTPTLKVEFELSESDLAFFRDRLDKAREDRADLDESRITAGVADMISKALASNPPEFVRSRLGQLCRLEAGRRRPRASAQRAGLFLRPGRPDP